MIDNTESRVIGSPDIHTSVMLTGNPGPRRPIPSTTYAYMPAIAETCARTSAKDCFFREGSFRGRGRITPPGAQMYMHSPVTAGFPQLSHVVAMSQCRNVLMSHHDMDTDSSSEVRQVRSCVDSGVGSAETVSTMQNGEMGWV